MSIEFAEALGSDDVNALVTTADSAPRYRRRVADSLASGWRFAGLHVSADATSVRTLLVSPYGATHVMGVALEAGCVPSVVDLAPAATWDEREAHDLFGIGFTGHRPLRPLLDHRDHPAHPDRPDQDDGQSWTVTVSGVDAYQVAVGPIHAGVIESGHFRFHLVGDRMLHLDARLFYKHRGLEQAAIGVPVEDGTVYAARACGACAVANSVAYAHAAEQTLGVVPTAELARVRTVLLELERLWNHLNDIAAVCAGVGLAAGNNRFAAFTDRARGLNAALSGHRFLFGTVRVGGSDLALGRAQVAQVRAGLADLRREVTRSWRELLFNASFAQRLSDVGIVGADRARQLGTVGPAARAAGLAQDVRTGSPRLAYTGFEPVAPERAVGDVQARFEQRAAELWQSFALLDGLLDRPLVPAVGEPGAPPRQTGVGRVESPRGATSCVIERDGARIARMRLRTGSYANWPSVAAAADGNLLPDFPLINKSFELCYACADR
jgi:Ni,Fe-hydrogenase III large subunit